MPGYHYQFHGLRIFSTIAIDGAPSLESGPIDVTVTEGDVPDNLPAPSASGVLFDAAPGDYILRVGGVGRYRVQRGCEITVAPHPDATPHLVQTFLTGGAFTALLHQRGVLVMHGSAVLGPTGVLIVAGHSGTGKSTTCAALLRAGYPVLTDDISAVSIDGDGVPRVAPGVARMRLWADAMTALQADPAGAHQLRPGVDKFTVAIPQMAASPHPLVSICCLELYSGHEVVCDRLDGSSRFEALRQYTRMSRLVEGLQVQEHHFRAAAAVSARTPVWRLRRPRGTDSLSAVVRHAERLLG